MIRRGDPVRIEIETPRLRLRQWIDADFEPLVVMNADPRVMEFFPSTLSREETASLWDRIQTHFETNGFGPWAVEVDREFAGWLGLMRPRFEAHFTPCVEVGYRLRPEFWGKGLATEGASAVLRYGFERLHLDGIVAFTIPANRRSRRVMEKIGLTHAGDFDHPQISEGHPMRRHVLYRISREDWTRRVAGVGQDAPTPRFRG